MTRNRKWKTLRQKSGFLMETTDVAQYSAGGTEMDMDFRDFTAYDESSSATLIVENQKLHVHREILSLHSPVFKAIFDGDTRIRRRGMVDMWNKKLEDVVELLRCLYPPMQSIEDHNVYAVLPLVEEYQMKDLKNKCEDFLLTKPGSLDLYLLAEQYQLPRLLQQSTEALRYMNSDTLAANLGALRLRQNVDIVEADSIFSVLMMRIETLEQEVEAGETRAMRRQVDLAGVKGILEDLVTESDDHRCLSYPNCGCNSRCYDSYRTQVEGKVKQALELCRSCERQT